MINAPKCVLHTLQLYFRMRWFQQKLHHRNTLQNYKMLSVMFNMSGWCECDQVYTQYSRECIEDGDFKSHFSSTITCATPNLECNRTMDFVLLTLCLYIVCWCWRSYCLYSTSDKMRHPVVKNSITIQHDNSVHCTLPSINGNNS